MYKMPPISNLAISDQGNGLSWKWFKVDKGRAHSFLQNYVIVCLLNMFKLLHCQITLSSTEGCKEKLYLNSNYD